MKRLKTELNALVNRGVDRHLRLAVTGLSPVSYTHLDVYKRRMK
nr:hypothetical protein [Klebsiella variicola]